LGGQKTGTFPRKIQNLQVNNEGIQETPKKEDLDTFCSGAAEPGTQTPGVQGKGCSHQTTQGVKKDLKRPRIGECRNWLRKGKNETRSDPTTEEERRRGGVQIV